MACVQDLKQFCDDGTSFYSDPDDIAKKFSDQMCLVRHMEEISSECADSINVEGNIAKKCFHDIDTRCGDVKPGDNKIHTCLWEQVDELESQCAEHIATTAKRLNARKTNQSPMIPQIQGSDYSMPPQGLSSIIGLA